MILAQFSDIWVEFTLALFAAIAYFAMSRWQGKQSLVKISTISAKPMQQAQGQEAPRAAAKTGWTDPAELAQMASQAIRQRKLSESVQWIQQMPETVAGSVHPNLAFRLLCLAASAQRLSEALLELKPLKGKIPAIALETVINDAIRNKEVAACRRLHIIAKALMIPKSQGTCDALATAYATDASALRDLVEEVHAAAMRTPLPVSFARIVLDACAAMKEQKLAAEVLEKLSSADAASLREHMPADVESRTSTKHASGASSDKSTSASANPSPRNSSTGEASTPRDVACAAAAIDQESGPSKDVALRANDIRSCGRNGDLKGAIKVFERLGDQAQHALIFNSILDACCGCKDMAKACEYFDRAKCQNIADVVTYNTMIKGYIAIGQESTAKKLVTELQDAGITPTRASYHGLINCRVNAKDYQNAWRLVADMQASDVTPNAVTCSILLKSKLTSPQEVSRVLALIDAMEEPIDEVLFLALVEACVRTGRLDSLSRQMNRFLQQSASANLTAPTYGSLIKAYGHAREVKRIWDLWNQMISNRVLPTSITLGCMVEQLVANGCTNDAWKLTQKMWNDESTQPLINTVVYSSILKGFANAQDTEKVMAVYQEMQTNQVTPNKITFNTILNAFAKGGNMHRVPALLVDMAAATPPIEPDIVSYSTIVKGYCNSGSLDRALQVVEDMKARGRHVPDEVMYNSLLAGCSKEHRLDEALQLLNDMRKFGVPPSNYTLSMIVKLMGRCRRINQAFGMLQEISKEYGLKINVQVYTCLIQGCFNSGQGRKAVELLDTIVAEGLAPDSMTYTVLVRGCLQSGINDEAVRLVKCAYGKAPGQSSKAAAAGLNAGCIEEVFAALTSAGDAASKALLVDLAECKLDAPAAQQTWRTPSAGNGAGSWRQQHA